MNNGNGANLTPLRRLTPVTLAMVLLASVLGCGANPTYYGKGLTGVGEDASLAILPPLNLSKHDRASDVVLNAAVVEMLDSEWFRVMDPGLVETVILEQRIRVTDRMSLEMIQQFAERLNVTHIMVGSITEFGHVQARSEQVPIVSVTLRIINCATGTITWAATHSRRGDDSETIFGMGRVESTDQLAGITVKEMLKSLKNKKRKSK